MMFHSLYIRRLTLGVLLVLCLVPAHCEQMTVCMEEDDDLRVDCLLDTKPSMINSYEFSMSSGTKETLVNTNVSGLIVATPFRDKSYVEELEPHGYRMTMIDYVPKFPANATFMCKVTKNVASVYVEKEHLLPCSAVSVFLQSCWWMMFPGLPFYLTHICSLTSH